MSGFLFDSNVLLDIATADANWLAWSEARLRAAAAQDQVLIYAEIAPAFATRHELDLWLHPQIFQWLDLPYSAGWRAAEAFVQYRRAGGTRIAPLPDFYIGAHAEVSGLTLVTRDAARYHTYFPKVPLVSPE